MDFVTNEPAKKERSRAKGILWKVLLVALIVFGLFFYWRYFYTYSSGIRVGLLQKFSHKGAIFKTYEGELILSSITSNNNVAIASEKFYFSVTDKSTADKLMHSQGRYVTLYYKQKNGSLSWRGDTPYIVDSVELNTAEESYHH